MVERERRSGSGTFLPAPVASVLDLSPGNLISPFFHEVRKIQREREKGHGKWD